MIGAVIAGWWSVQAMASVASSMPSSSAIAESCSKRSEFRVVPVHPAGELVESEAGVGRRGLGQARYLPVSSPPASGLKQMMPTPSSRHSGNRSRSHWRKSRL